MSNLDSLTTYATVTHGNEVTQGLDRAYFTEMMLPAIRAAKDSVHIAMLAMDGGRFPNHVADLLIEKKKANPDFKVRIIADDVGSAMPFGFGKGSSMVERLRDAGIEVELNLMARDGLEHRKVVIVDGETAFFGGACLSDPYFASDDFFKALDALPASERDPRLRRVVERQRRIWICKSPRFEIRDARLARLWCPGDRTSSASTAS